jgi:hypothetical protein
VFGAGKRALDETVYLPKAIHGAIDRSVCGVRFKCREITRDDDRERLATIYKRTEPADSKSKQENERMLCKALLLVKRQDIERGTKNNAKTIKRQKQTKD